MGCQELHEFEGALEKRGVKKVVSFSNCSVEKFHPEQSRFGAVERKRAEVACSVVACETLTPVGLGGLVKGKEKEGKGKEVEEGKEVRTTTTEYYNLFPEPEVFPIFSEEEDDIAIRLEEEDPLEAEPASGSASFGQEEAQSARPLRPPPVPTPQMIAEHEVTHIPHRSWCPACVAGRGRSYAHHHEARDSTVPVISADYLYFSDKGSTEKSLPTVVIRDRLSKAILSPLLPAKGVGSAYPEKAVLRDKTDQENAIKALGTAVKAGFPNELTLEESPKGDHHGQSNGAAENAVQRIQDPGTSKDYEVCPGREA